MMLEFKLPQFGMGMTDGTIIRWVKSEGDAVTEGETLFEVEAAKTTVEVPSPVTGMLASIVVPVDQNVPVQTIVALIAVEGDVPADPAPAAEAQVAAILEQALARRSSTPLARRVAEQVGIDPALVKGTGPNGRIRRKDVESAIGASAVANGKRWNAGQEIEPRARRAARVAGLDLSKVIGSGRNGRIVEADVKSHLEAPVLGAPVQLAVQPVTRNESEASFTEIPHSRMRSVIAKRLSESKATVPHFYLVAHCEIDRLIEARRRINASFPGAKVSLNDFVIVAMARALEIVPEANVGWTETAMRHYTDVDVSVAVATEGGLITPIVRRANVKSVRAIAAETKELAAKARSGQLSPSDYNGGNVSVSNLGMFGTEEFSAIINPPQACILAVGAGTQRPVVRNGALAVATVMTCTLSVDHRAIDGAVAAQLMQTFKTIIEDPVAQLS